MFRLSITVTALAIVVFTGGVVLYGAQHVVNQKGRLFSPGSVTVKVGDEVVFKNDDSVTHHVYSSTRGQDFELETTEPREQLSRTFSKPGRVDVRCGLHPGMRLIINVK